MLLKSSRPQGCQINCGTGSALTDEREETAMASGTKKHDALVDALLQAYTKPQDILGAQGVLRQWTTRLGERARDAALTAHLGYAPHARHGSDAGHWRNGQGK